VNNITSVYTNLDPSKKKLLHIVLLGGGVLFVVFILSSMAGGEKKERRDKPTIGSILTDKDPREVGLDSLNSTQAAQARKMTEMARNLKTLMEKTQVQDEVKDQLKEVTKMVSTFQEKVDVASTQADSLKAQNEDLQKQLLEVKKNGPVGKNGKAITPEENEAAQKQLIARKKYDHLVNDPNKNQSAFFANAPTPVEEVLKPGQANRKDEVKKITSIAEDGPEDDVNIEKEVEIYLPAGSIMSGALITGVDAPTGSGARRDPFPVLLRVKKEAVLPNRFRADIRECFLVASAFGDLSSERAYMRAETISCVRDDGGVIETGLDAYASGEDGKAGVRGRLISKQGAILARSLMAGFMQGVSQAFSVNQVPSINLSGSGTGNNQDSVTPVYAQALNAQAMQGAAVSGAGKALERIADFYLEMAENLYPVIEVDAAREIDFIVKKGVQLKLQTGK
jgi:conjugal transfer pilus assembly protein TraB